MRHTVKNGCLFHYLLLLLLQHSVSICHFASHRRHVMHSFRATVLQTLFNPNKTVVKMFVVVYDLSDMPANCQTFLRQRTLYMPVSCSRGAKPEDVEQPVFLRYLIHLRSDIDFGHFQTARPRPHIHTGRATRSVTRGEINFPLMTTVVSTLHA